MKKSCLVLMLAALGCIAVVGAVGCTDQTATTTSDAGTAGGATTTFGELTTTAGQTGSTETAPDSWTELHPSGGPPPGRTAASMVYDSLGGKMILFGGAGDTAFNDTWAYDPTADTWTELHPTGSAPCPRVWASMVYDPTGGRVILFGGERMDASGYPGSLGDTWAYDPLTNTWAELHPAGRPSERYGHAMVYDPSGGKVILFGGETADLDRGVQTFFDDTWAYDPAVNTWTELHPTGELPPGLFGASMVYDSNRSKALLFGTPDAPGDFVGDLWAYDPAGNTWTELHPTGTIQPAAAAPLLPRFGHSLVYDPTADQVILFGGFGDAPDTYGEFGDLDDTWAYDPAGNTWTRLDPTGTVPPARAGHCMVYDSCSDRLVLFGGSGGISGRLNDTWSYRPRS